MPRIFLHHIDVINNQYISGWCLNRLLPQLPLTLQIFANGERIGQAQCNLTRKDVRKAGLHKTGKCGFMFRFPANAIHNDTNLTFSVKGLPGNVFSCDPNEIESVLVNNPPVFFMHIPKTAGTSFNNHVQSWFGADQWHIHTETYQENRLRDLAQPGVYLAGHLPLYKLTTIFPDLSVLNLHSILREPLAQFHSHLAWIKGIGLQPDSVFFQSHPGVVQSLSLKLQKQVINTPDALSKLVNQLDGFEWDFFDNIQTRYFLESRPDKVSEIDAVRAVNNLKRFSSVGLTEQYTQFLQAMSDQYHREFKSQPARHNTTKVAPLFDLQSKEIRAALSPLIKFDQQLYDYVSSSIVQADQRPGFSTS